LLPFFKVGLLSSLSVVFKTCLAGNFSVIVLLIIHDVVKEDAGCLSNKTVLGCLAAAAAYALAFLFSHFLFDLDITGINKSSLFTGG
jgi:hypothetical protein